IYVRGKAICLDEFSSVKGKEDNRDLHFKAHSIPHISATEKKIPENKCQRKIMVCGQKGGGGHYLCSLQIMFLGLFPVLMTCLHLGVYSFWSFQKSTVNLHSRIKETMA
ncbi:unnamed protein product, partial [Owenia fusiformis]